MRQEVPGTRREPDPQVSEQSTSEQSTQIKSLDEITGEAVPDIREILHPKCAETTVDLTAMNILTGSEAPDTLASGYRDGIPGGECEFLTIFPHPRPLLYNRPELYSSRLERLEATKPRLSDLARKKRAQRRMRIIIFVDIILFIVILGVIYPSLRKIQSGGRLAGYRFSFSQSLENQEASEPTLNIVAKVEQLSRQGKEAERKIAVDAVSEPEAGFTVSLSYRGRLLLQEYRSLPRSESPVNYALFRIPYEQLITRQDSRGRKDGRFAENGLEIHVDLGQQHKEFYLQVTEPAYAVRAVD